MEGKPLIVIHHTALGNYTDQKFDKVIQGINRDHFNRISTRTSDWNTSIVYHFLVKQNGEVVQTRPLDDAGGSTLDQSINLRSVAIAYLNNGADAPTDAQYKSMRLLVIELKKLQPNADVIRHKDVWHTSPTGCGKNVDMSRIIDEPKKEAVIKESGVWEWKDGKKYLGMFNLSRYYSVIPWQSRYYNGKTYEQDLKDQFNGDKDTLHAAWWPVNDSMAMKIAACPPSLPLWSIIEIEGWWQITCYDRGSAIQAGRLDIYCGVWTDALDRWSKCWTGSNKKVYLIK